MLQRLRNSQENEKGFTLIELLVVILIIAILAAIAIPVFLRQRERGYVAQNESALKNAATAMESYATANDGNYPADNDVAALETEGFRNVQNVAITFTSTAGTGYCITGTHSLLASTHDSQIMTWDSDEGNPDDANTC